MFQRFVTSIVASVGQMLGGALHRINHYPADKYEGNQLHHPLNQLDWDLVS